MVGLGKENEMRGENFPGASRGAYVENIFDALSSINTFAPYT